jgi:DNA glycosylase AlkZ-like
MNGVTQEDVRAALWESRTLVKAWTLRGTLHLHPADELPLWFAARRAVRGDTASGLDEWRDPAGMVHPALDAGEVTEIRSAVLAALDGRTLLREEIVEAVLPHVGRRAEGRLRSGFAFFLGETCQGPPRGNKITLARPDQWLGRWHEVDETEALQEVCRRFLRTYGPSTARAFRGWFGAQELPGDAIEEIEVEGTSAFVVAGDKRFPKPVSTLRLLPEYDAYVMGFRERDQLVPDAVRAQVAAHRRGRYEGPAGVRFLLIDGMAAGIWERKKHPKRVELSVTPSRKLTRAEREQLDAEAERIGGFLGLEPVLTLG